MCPPRTAVLAIALGILGCQDPYYSRCESNSDCGDYACLRLGTERACVPRCAIDADCEVLASHPNAYCGLVGGCLLACTSDADCPEGAECDVVEGACTPRSER